LLGIFFSSTGAGFFFASIEPAFSFFSSIFGIVSVLCLTGSIFGSTFFGSTFFGSTFSDSLVDALNPLDPPIIL
jgi:hypothetical protein